MGKIPLPSNVLPGDELHMGKGADGNWGISKCVRVASGGQLAPTAAAHEWRSAKDMAADCAGPSAIMVRMDTTKGPIFMKIVPAWSPIGAKRFLQLVDDGYYKDIAIYRAINGGLLQ